MVAQDATRTIQVSAFRDQCLRLMDEINETGESVVVTKHGKPVVVVSAAQRPVTGFVGLMAGVTRIFDDLEAPAIPPEEWRVVSAPDRVDSSSSDNPLLCCTPILTRPPARLL